MKNKKNQLSLTGENKKMTKISFPLMGKTRNSEKRSSAADEMQKTPKIGFRPWPTGKKQQKLHFGHGRNAENGKNSVSSMADEPKTAKADFRPRPKLHYLFIE